mmetsp:Transcript_50306/g.121797  ORF Transcript_50306/g.121797 Transcript_50306/m.121797 type:complete len:331 (-) Transcript_50306:102-1094(-)
MDVHNYLPLSNHRVFYDQNPKLLIIPILRLKDIKEWDGKEEYEVLVIAADSQIGGDEIDAALIYRCLLVGYHDKDRSSDQQGGDDNYGDQKSDIAKPEEVETARKTLTSFIKAQAEMLVGGIPQELLKLATGCEELSSTSPKSTGGGTMASLPEDDATNESYDDASRGQEGVKSHWDHESIKNDFEKNGVPIPQESDAITNVLKVKVAFKYLPDPWLLMAKAASNFTYIVTGKNVLPPCKPYVHESNLQYEESVRLHEQRERTVGIPAELILSNSNTPTKYTSGESMKLEFGIPPPRTNVDNPPNVVTPEPDGEGGVEESTDDGWENFDD